MTGSVLLIVFSGNPQKFASHLAIQFPGVAADSHLVDEKSIAHVQLMWPLLHERKHSAVCFGIKELELQRYLVVLKFYLLTASTRQRLILDEAGNVLKVSMIPYLVFDIPRFLFELFASVVVLVRSYFTLMFHHQSGSKN